MVRWGWGKESMGNVGVYLKLTLSSPKLTMASPDTDGILKVCFSHFIISSELYFKWLFLPFLLYDFYLWIVGLPQRKQFSQGHRLWSQATPWICSLSSAIISCASLDKCPNVSIPQFPLPQKRYVMVEPNSKGFWEAQIKSVNCSEVLVYSKLLLLSNLT